MLIIGLTGGIGSGKSTVARLFQHLGVTVIDMDEISRHVTQRSTQGLTSIVQHFGKSILNLDNTLNRTALRKIIFSNPSERRWLEKLLHPLIWDETRKQISQSQSPYCIIVIPLLTESQPHSLIQRILVVDTRLSEQIKRTRLRDLHAADTVTAIVKTQSTREKRLQLADDVIHNDGLPENLKISVKSMHEKYLTLAKKKT